MAAYFFKLSSVKTEESSVTSTSKSFSFPNFLMAASPLGIALCLYPAVFAYTNILFPLLEPVDSSLQAKRIMQHNKLKKINCFFILQTINVKRELNINAKNEMEQNELI